MSENERRGFDLHRTVLDIVPPEVQHVLQITQAGDEQGGSQAHVEERKAGSRSGQESGARR